MSAKTERGLWYGVFTLIFLFIAYDVAGLFGVWDHQQAQGFGTALPQGPAVFETSLQDRISSTDTSLTLVANSVRGGSTLSGYNCFTIDEGLSAAEYVCGSVSGTTVSSLERGIDPLTGTTTNATLKRPRHASADHSGLYVSAIGSA